MRTAAKWSGLIAGFGLVLVSASVGMAQCPDVLESRAAALIQSRADYVKAARAFGKAAALRAQDDPRAVTDLRLAGLLYADAGDLRRAGSTMEKAGLRALALGDFGAAAEAYTNAAFIAARVGSARAAMLAHRALWLAQREGVSAGARALVQQRLRPAAT